MIPRAVTAVGSIVVVAAVTAVPLRVHGSGVGDIANHPIIVVPMGTATVVLVVAASALTDRAHRPTRTRLAATGLAMFGYLALTAALAWHAGERGARDQIAEALVAAQGVAWVPPITLLTLTFLAALDELRVAGRTLRRIAAGLGVYTGAALGLVFLTTLPPEDSPYADLPPLWDGGPFLATVGDLLLVPWMLSILIAPVVAWRTVSRAPGARRGRVLAIALASMTPPVTIVFCLVATALAYAAGVLSTDAGAASLSIAFHLPFVLAAAGIVHALRGRGAAATPRRVTVALTVTVGTPLLIVVVAVGWLLAAGLGGRGIALVVVGTLMLGAVASAARRRLVRALLLRIDPARARAAAAMGTGDSVGETSPAHELERVVREALRDPHAAVSLCLPGDRWVYVDGRASPRPGGPATPQAHVEPANEDSASALDEARALVDRATLELTVRDQEAAVAAAQARADTAAAIERRRLERDLHDGVQGRLLAIALDLRVAQRTLPDSEAHLVIADAVEALSKAIEELRTLSRGTGPDLLSRRGLRVALTDFTARMPLPVTLVRAPERLTPAVESVIYLVVCEAVTNAVKHARATAVDIDVTTDRELALVTVTDDGVGGADLRAGTGLRGLSERVAAAGGRLLVSDHQPHGTLVEVTLPCAS